MTLDVISNSPFASKVNTRQFEGESSSLSEVTWGFFPRTPSIVTCYAKTCAIYSVIHLPKARPSHLKVSGRYARLGYLETFECPLFSTKQPLVKCVKM